MTELFLPKADEEFREAVKSGKMALKNQKGITLIELIVFIIVAAVAMPVIVVPVLSLLKESTKPEKAITANFLGQKVLEVITANDFPTLTNTSSSPPIPPSALPIAEPTPGRKKFRPKPTRDGSKRPSHPASGRPVCGLIVKEPPCAIASPCRLFTSSGVM